MSTRNPHAARKPGADLSKDMQELLRLPLEERIPKQWKACFGCPISDEAKAQFTIHTLGKSFHLGDVRLWQVHHNRKNDIVTEAGKVYLEFFFDGCPEELGGKDDVFTKAFEDLLERQLREVRVSEFRKKLAARKRAKDKKASDEASVDFDDEGGAQNVTDEAEEEWQSFLKKPTPDTELSVRALREAGCMLRFLVCQTSLSCSAAEVLGQLAFPEHFPIDGKAQELAECTKPLPRWVYIMSVVTALFMFITIAAWWQVAREVMHRPLK